MNTSIDIFLPKGMERSELPLDNPHCISVATSWILCESTISDDALWLANECAYFGFDKDEALVAAVAGFVLLYQKMKKTYAEQIEIIDQIRETLSLYERILLKRLDPDFITDGDSRQNALILGSLRSQVIQFYSDMDEKDVIAVHYMRECMSDRSWLVRMAEAQLHMYDEETDKAGVQVEELYNELFRSLLPEEMQDEQFVIKLISATAELLTTEYPNDFGIWRSVADVFIETINSEV